MIDKKRRRAGFTLVEIMVAVVILAVGLLGMAAMTIMVIRGNRMAVRQTNATNLAQQLLERLKDVNFTNIGTQINCSNSAPVTSITNGQTGVICYQFPVDAQSNVQTFPTTLPVYGLFLKVCDNTVAAEVPSSTPSLSTDYCTAGIDSNVFPAVLPAELACMAALSGGEKEIKVVASWWEQGTCHHVDFSTVVVQ